MPTISFKVTPQEAREIRARARAAKASNVSDFLRKTILTKNTEPSSLSLTRNPDSGLPCVAGAQPISSEQVKELLADFP